MAIEAPEDDIDESRPAVCARTTTAVGLPDVVDSLGISIDPVGPDRSAQTLLAVSGTPTVGTGRREAREGRLTGAPPGRRSPRGIPQPASHGSATDGTTSPAAQPAAGTTSTPSAAASPRSIPDRWCVLGTARPDSIR